MARTATIYRVEDASRAERFGIEPQILGGATGVWKRLRRGLPGLYSRGWEGWLAGDGWKMQLSTWRQLLPSSRGAVDSIQVDVDGDGDPLPLLLELCLDQGWSLFDDETGCFVDLDDPAGMSWNGEPMPAPPPPRTLAMMLVPEALRREFSRREIVLLDLDGPPALDEDGPIHRFPLGHADDVREHLHAVMPPLRWFGRRGRAAVDGTRIDVYLRSSGLIDTLRISISGPDADDWLRRLCEPMGWSALEPALGDFPYLHETATELPPMELPSNVIALRPR
ncbi:MAG: hypothetical protein KDA24_21900 [Deltaproteobacteria bacterium]|nr:hypothetical protein [Deltaproteobacteria bacterium]